MSVSAQHSHTQVSEQQSQVALIDVDANLRHEALVGDVVELIQTAQGNGVAQFVAPASTLQDSKASLELAQTFKNTVFATVGVHPYHCLNPIQESDMKYMRELASAPECRAVGECGLDTTQGFPSLSEQLPWFKAQVRLACDLNKPLFLHQRGAFQQFNAVLDEQGDRLPPVLIHCFTGSAMELEHYIKRGFSVSLSGFVFRPSFTEEHSSSIMNTLPLDKVMIETDAPYMGFKVPT